MGVKGRVSLGKKLLLVVIGAGFYCRGILPNVYERKTVPEFIINRGLKFKWVVSKERE